MSHAPQRYLMAYSGLLTLAFAAVVLTGFTRAPTKFDEIDVQRINVREPDGSLRLVISNRSRFPGAILRAKEYPHDRQTAGLLFFNDEGTENGGLIYGGQRKDGKILNYGHLSFDQFEQDQVLNLEQSEENGVRTAGLMVNDAPDRSMVVDMEEQPRLDAMPEAERNKLFEERARNGYYLTPRLYVGKNRDRDSVVNLKDGKGRNRLRLRVSADGAAAIEFLDAEGKVQRTLTPESLKQ